MSVLRVLSLGAGVQSTTLALMAAHGEIGLMPDCAIFGDTEAEPGAVYEHLRWLMSPNVLPFPVHIVSAGSLTDEIGRVRKSGRAVLPLPVFIYGEDGRPAIANRSCTADFKIVPVRRQIREILGLTNRRSPDHVVAEQWIGISTDEADRMSPTGEDWLQNRWPLIEKGMSRGDCYQWLARNGYPEPPKSSCTYCPFHSDAEWARLRDSDPEGWAEAVSIDARVRGLWAGKTPSKAFLHRGMRPLAETVFSTDRQPDLFRVECKGMCGV